MKRLRIGHDWELGINDAVVVEFEHQEVVVRRSSIDHWVAYSRHCPHQNADLIEAEIIGETLRCPWHGLQFQLGSGNCLTNQCTPLTTFPLKIENGEVFIYPQEQPTREKQFYLARYGWDSRIGLFSNDLESNLDNGVDYVGQTGRGMERVTILSQTKTKESSFIAGRIVRILSDKDHSQHNIKLRNLTQGNSVPANSDQDVANLLQEELDRIAEGHQVIHVEFLLDGNVIAHLLGAPSRRLGPLASKASQALMQQVTFEFAKFTE